jgi:hypothetical protein
MRLVSAASGLVGFVLLLAFGAYAFFSPSIETPGAVLGALGVFGLGLWLWLDRDVLRRAAQSQGARFTAASILVVFVTAGIAVALNVLAHRYDDRIDLTEAGTYTLSAETEKIVQALDRPVEVIAFVSESTPEKGRIDELIASYKALSDKLTVRELDPVRNPMEAEQNKITSDLATPIEGRHVGDQLNQVARDKSGGESQVPQQLHHEPGGISARAAGILQSLFRRLDSGLHADQIPHCLLHIPVQVHQKQDRFLLDAWHVAQELRELRTQREGRQVGAQFSFLLR